MVNETMEPVQPLTPTLGDEFQGMFATSKRPSKPPFDSGWSLWARST